MLEQIKFNDNRSPFLLPHIETAIHSIHILFVIARRIECLHFDFVLGLGLLRVFVAAVATFVVGSDMDHLLFEALVVAGVNVPLGCMFPARGLFGAGVGNLVVL